MYIIDARHYLDDKGAIAPQRGPARRMAVFVTSAIAHASDFDRPEDVPGPQCFRCRVRDDKRVKTSLDQDDVVIWSCAACGTQGRISNWQGTFWDLS
jgi:RNase P subunit RPR2